jgi:hypothetical protein
MLAGPGVDVKALILLLDTKAKLKKLERLARLNEQ